MLNGAIVVELCSAAEDADVSVMASKLIPLVRSGMDDPANLSHLKGIKGTFQLTVMQNGQKAGTWCARADANSCTLWLVSSLTTSRHIILDGDKKKPEIVEGASSAKPTLATTVSDDIILKLAMGKENPIKAFMSGKVKIQGNLMLAQKLEAAFRNAKGYEVGRVFATEFVKDNEYLKSKL